MSLLKSSSGFAANAPVVLSNVDMLSVLSVLIVLFGLSNGDGVGRWFWHLYWPYLMSNIFFRMKEDAMPMKMCRCGINEVRGRFAAALLLLCAAVLILDVPPTPSVTSWNVSGD